MRDSPFATKSIKRIGILTSGGDAPGMNACIRAIVRRAVQEGMKIIGFHKGYWGVLERNCVTLDARAVSNIIHKFAHTGDEGDGRVFVSNVEQGVNIRTGEKGEKAL